MRILSAEETTALLPYPALAQTIAKVLQDHRQGLITAPERLVVGLAGGATLLLMPASDPEITVTKLVTVHPEQRPAVKAEVWVMRTQTGERLLLLDGSVVTARRTAAVSLLAAQKLAPNPSGTLLIMGAGTQGQSHLEAFQAGLGTDKVYICSRNLEHAEALAAYARQLRMLAQAISDPSNVLDEVSLIVTATTSKTPVLLDPVREDAFIAAVGAYRPDMAEVDPALVRRCAVVVDTLAGARSEAGDLLQADIDWNQVKALEDVLEAKPSAGPVLFKSVGHALWDLAAARLAATAPA